MEAVKKKFEFFSKKPFPANDATDETASDLFMDLAEYDGYVAGFIDQALNGKKVDSSHLEYDQNLEDQLRNCIINNELDDKSNMAVKNYIDYMLEIKEILKELKAQM